MKADNLKSNLGFISNFELDIKKTKNGYNLKFSTGFECAATFFSCINDVEIYIYKSKGKEERNYLHARRDNDTLFFQTVQNGMNPGGSTFTVERSAILAEYHESLILKEEVVEYKIDDITYPFDYTNHYDNSIINCKDNHILKQSGRLTICSKKEFLELLEENHSRKNDYEIINMVGKSQHSNNSEISND